MSRPFSLRIPTAMTVRGDFTYEIVGCPCGWSVTLGLDLPAGDYSTAIEHATTCTRAHAWEGSIALAARRAELEGELAALNAEMERKVREIIRGP